MTKLQKIGFKDYKDYLNSDAWVFRKQWYKKLYPEKCFVCLQTGPCHLHHVTYKNVGEETDADLVWLCESHHDKIHNVVNGKPLIKNCGRIALLVLRRNYAENNLRDVNADDVDYPIVI